MTTFSIPNLAALESVVQALLPHIQRQPKVAFYGEMGAGKTTLITALVKALGSTDPVQSPTFSLIQAYDTPTLPIRHLDLYRLEDPEEAWSIGVEDLLYDAGYTFIEWPNIIEDWLPDTHLSLLLRVDEEGVRHITLA